MGDVLFFEDAGSTGVRLKKFVADQDQKKIQRDNTSPSRETRVRPIIEGELTQDLARAVSVSSPTQANLRVYRKRIVDNAYLATGEIITLTNRDTNIAGLVGEYVMAEWNGNEWSPVSGRISSNQGPFAGAIVYLTGPGTYPGTAFESGIYYDAAGLMTIIPTTVPLAAGNFITLKNIYLGGGSTLRITLQSFAGPIIRTIFPGDQQNVRIDNSGDWWGVA